MILGTYWYFHFPAGLYEFDYFEFKNGQGGHADNPAELITNIKADNPEKIISDLKSLISKYNEGFLFIYQDGQKLTIGTGGHQLFDYDFLLISEVEKILKKEKTILNLNQKLENPLFIKICSDNSTTKFIYPKKAFLQLVGSNLKKHNAETASFRLDCNLEKVNRSLFINDLKKLAKEENINVLFYYDKDFDTKTNLMIFLTNGRQGLNMTSKQFVNTSSLETYIEELLIKYNVELGHKSGVELYPQNGPHIEMIIDSEFIF